MNLHALQAGWNGKESTIYLVVAIICLLISGLCIWWSWHCFRNKPDPNVAQSKNWLSKWLYKNRTIWSLMVTVIVIILAIIFFLETFGIHVIIPNPD